MTSTQGAKRWRGLQIIISWTSNFHTVVKPKLTLKPTVQILEASNIAKQVRKADGQSFPDEKW